MTYSITFLISGCLTGLLLSAPVGAANILCLERTLKSGAFSGFITGSGAAFGDFLFVIAALTGLIALGDFQAGNAELMGYIGGLILIIFAIFSLVKGIMQYKNVNAQESLLILYGDKKGKNIHKAPYLSGFTSTFILTVTNPLTPIGVVSAVAAVGLGGGILVQNPIWSAGLFAVGVLIGSLSWWYGLTQFAHQFASRLTGRALSYINFFGALLMIGMAVYLFLYL
jgi:threonine/homoserine/homoserine lactone efflux protein